MAAVQRLVLDKIVDKKLEGIQVVSTADLDLPSYHIAIAIAKEFPDFHFDCELYEFPLPEDCLDGLEKELRAAVSVPLRRKNRKKAVELVMERFGTAACRRLLELGEVERFMKSVLVKKERGLEKKRKFYLDEIARKGRDAAEMRKAVSTYFGTLDTPMPVDDDI